MQKAYTAMFVTDEGETVHKPVILDEDILLQYCIACDAHNEHTLDTIHSVACANEALQEAIIALDKRFDSQESMTQQLLAYRKGLHHA